VGALGAGAVGGDGDVGDDESSPQPGSSRAAVSDVMITGRIIDAIPSFM
jgi:hypothetical protein